jgi:magnesium-protoporphyrin IX monomethyl ester (oxidative) cyclase
MTAITPTAATTATSREQVTASAVATTLLSPRFYRTDYAALDRMDITPLRAEWQQLLDEFRTDLNRNHFERDEAFSAQVRELPPELFQEFLDFLVSSVTAEFSGCVLYSEIKRHVKNPELRELMGFMARDESRMQASSTRRSRIMG